MSEISTHSAKTAIAGRNNSGSFPAWGIDGVEIVIRTTDGLA
jgi:hypothetical protein